MNITILGWYGTETIGDRAILGGVIKILYSAFGRVNIKLGSINPFFSDRTISEDFEIWQLFTNRTISISLFDTRNIIELKSQIENSSLVLIGGGPLMHLNELNMLEFAFRYAKKKSIKTAIFGCGVGPLFKGKKFRRNVIEIIRYSDLILLRDSQSYINTIELFDEFSLNISKYNIQAICDPALICAHFFKIGKEFVCENIISICVRSFPEEYSRNNISNMVNKNITDTVHFIARANPELEVLLTPMHYFDVGGDDRDFLNHILLKCHDVSNLHVINRNLNLESTMENFAKSKESLGMRFHSVVLQTILNGNNYVLDYTEPQKGKIAGFLKDIDKQGFYNKRVFQLQLNQVFKYVDNCDANKFQYPEDFIISAFEKFCFEIKNLMN